MNSKKIIILSISVFIGCLLTNFLKAQTFEEYKKQRGQEFQQYKENETRKMQELRNKYDEYVKAREDEYGDYLKKEWESFQAFKGIPVPEPPKPEVIPVYTPPPQKPENITPERQPENITKIPVISKEIPKSEEKPNARLNPLITKIEPENFLKSDLSFTFYGAKILVDFDKAMVIPSPRPISEDGIGLYWTKACKTNYTGLINQLLQYKNLMCLNDWGYYLLVRQTAQKITLPDPNSQNLLTWFLLCRSGYKAKISYAEEKTSVIIPADQVMYGKDYLTIDQVNYYFLDPVGSNIIHTYARDYPDATRVFDFNIDKALNLGETNEERTFSFTYANQPYLIKVKINDDVIAFYRDYPLVNMNVYFDAAVERMALESLADALLPILKPMSEVEKVNFLLKFVQTAFQYKVDQEQFGKEKYFFAEELFYYPYSDCEDRSVLFAFLVDELLDMKVIGLGYDGHVATAVHFSDQAGVEGSYFIFRNDKFIVADPTYINAPAGLTMPQYSGSEAEVIEISKVNYSENMGVDYRELVTKAGGYRGGNQKDMIVDESGNVFMTGYFLGSFQNGAKKITGDAENRSSFTAKFNRYGELQWVSAPKGQAVSTGFAIIRDDQQNVLIAGSFQGQAYFGGYTLTSRQGKPDVFVAKYDPQGNIVWAGQAGLDTLDQESYLKYVAKFARNGVNLGTDLYVEDVEFSEDGLFTDDQGVSYLAGNLSGTTGFRVKEKAFMDGGEVDFPTLIKNESDRLISLKVERNIAAIFAITNLIRSNGMMIPGQAAQQTLDKYQPGFKKEFPELYAMIGKITFMKNGDGIITLATKDQETIYYDKLKISNGTQIKITQLQDGNEKLEILSGIKVGKMVIWFTLNFIQMDRLTGNLLFDYDSSHMQLDMNLKEDIIGD
jgi:hypothetical protein